MKTICTLKYRYKASNNLEVSKLINTSKTNILLLINYLESIKLTFQDKVWLEIQAVLKSLKARQEIAVNFNLFKQSLAFQGFSLILSIVLL